MEIERGSDFMGGNYVKELLKNVPKVPKKSVFLYNYI